MMNDLALGLATIDVPREPARDDRVGMNDGVLGLLLQCLGVGSIVAMPLAGAFAAEAGCRRVITVSALVWAQWTFP
jgi:hypothetical protein